MKKQLLLFCFKVIKGIRQQGELEFELEYLPGFFELFQNKSLPKL